MYPARERQALIGADDGNVRRGGESCAARGCA
jgi:hypothetical protein